MSSKISVLFLEIDNYEIIISAGKIDTNDHFELSYKEKINTNAIIKSEIFNYNEVSKILKKNLFLIEEKLNITFKEIILILNDSQSTSLNLMGYKKLNGSQLSKENVTYIINLLKSKINAFESNKHILHIFNVNFFLDQKKIKNLPIGLFGDFYSHELSFFFIDQNKYKNIKNMIEDCNLRVKKVFLKSFIQCANIYNNQNCDTFFRIEIYKEVSNITFFENSALKLSQSFNFGSNLIINDISKITSLEKDTIKNIILNNNLEDTYNNSEFLEEKYFTKVNYRKIKKKLLYEIAAARIQELSEIILTNNINTSTLLKKSVPIFLKINDSNIYKNFKKCCKNFFSKNNSYQIIFIDDQPYEKLLDDTNKIVHFGWKSEAVPIISTKKSIIARFFDLLFN